MSETAAVRKSSVIALTTITASDHTPNPIALRASIVAVASALASTKSSAVSTASSDDPTIAIVTTSFARRTAEGDNGRLAQKAFARVGESSCSSDADRMRPTRTITYGRLGTRASGISEPYAPG